MRRRKNRGDAEGKRCSLLLGLLCALSANGCTWLSTQRWPAPQGRDLSELPPGLANRYAKGPEQIKVQRHSDPVRVLNPGALTTYPLNFYDRTLRATAGTAVLTWTGGRAEILWPSGTAAVLFDACIGWVGSPSRGEPTLDFIELTRAQLMLQPGDQVRLLGGAVLTGSSGPYVLERLAPDVQRVINQSKGTVSVAFREAVYELGPGQKVDLPLLSGGGAPRVAETGLRPFPVGRFRLAVAGDVQPAIDDGRAWVSADRELSLRGLGVRVRLAAGEQAELTDLAASDRSGGGP
jgi:hypothetical protein